MSAPATRTVHACHAAAAAELRVFPRVPMPVDIEDASAFPEIARAIEHARQMREQRS